MPVIRDWSLEVGIEQVLQAQGVDPQAERVRNSQIWKIAGRALEMGLPLLEPVVAYEELPVRAVSHERMTLGEEAVISGKLVVRALSSAQRVIALVGTIGGNLETLVSALLPKDPPLGLALDGLGTAAVESLLVKACSYFGKQAEAKGWRTTLPFSPGMESWPVDQGQLQIFTMVDPDLAGIQLTSSAMMIPQKSLSAVVGIGEDVDSAGRICDYCSLRQTCRYQDQYV